jgi:hypothetical protein
MDFGEDRVLAKVMVADVQPNATTSSSMLGRIRSTLGAILAPMAQNVSGVMSCWLKTRDS